MTETIESFAALQLPAPLLTALAAVGYETPTPIQAACIPHFLAGRDILGEAQTGTGKTAAFALPLLARLDLAKKMPQVLVLTPTRELAIQVAEAFQKYAHNMPGFHVLPVYGGQSMVIQLRALSRGVHVIVGTPGRIMDHLERKSLQLENLTTLVLDEADEMLRMGFIEDVEWILEHTPATRQTALFSATMPAPIRRIAQRYLRDPQEVRIHSATTTVATIRQRYWQVRGADKLEALTRMLEVEEDFEAALIFVRTKLATVDLAEKLEARGYEAAALNGDMTQGLREQVVERLKSGSLDIVIATDVAARGLDVPRISHVINYDVPYDTESYVHRIGRTGRAGRPGNAILFVAPREMRMLKAIEHATRQPIEAIGLPTRGEVAERRIGQFKQQIVDVLAEENLEFFFEVVRRMESEDNLAARQIAAALAFLAQRERPLQPPGFDVPVAPVFAAPLRAERPASFERPAPARPDGGDRPERPAREPRADREERPERKERPAPRNFSSSQVVRYRIEVGKNQGALPKEIVGAIANEGGIEGKLIGQINLFDDYSTVELPELPPEVLDILQRTRVRQLPLKIRVAAAGEGESRSRPPAKPRWENDRAPSSEARERRPASADFGRASGTPKPAARAEYGRGEGTPKPAFSDKPPYRSEKKPAPRDTGGRTERGAPPAGKPFNKFSGKPKKH
ncbi:MAG: DEAD/DEAH box helicase [Gammaproteobacteria bacterium]|nr:DEAD/DEAH box helicase [Rhodocyclaceae bacterium]MBU3909787.1 DEAD/DEAH box helicase [Gammaproteobacteria bacterium]MBU3990651.1 DEAD/DEAH box helicase [Gammaproteobacteria bacterium]MBU4005320.1 DEAD/DEAH box helicase [Gammaproteobacteria bacterium]MBU4022498.1 DEAD/DEAH box helicase [Gammaproteobacteria bacterium]